MKSKKAFKSLILAVTLGLSTTAAAKETIAIGELSWDGARGIQSVLKLVMEQHLGVDTKIVAVDHTVMYVGMDKGDGSIDVYPDLWMPQGASSWAKFIAPGSKETVLVNGKPYTAEQGLYIPGYIQDQYNVRTPQDLAKPEIAKLFDLDGDGKGDYWPGDPGWESTQVEAVKAKTYGYDKLFSPLQVSDAIFKAQLATAMRKKQGIAFYYWTPEWIHVAYDLRKLEEPKFTGYAMESKQDDPQYNPEGCWKMYTPKDSDQWLEQSRVECTWPDAQVYVGHSSSLVQRAPKVSQFLKQVEFDPKDVNDWILKIGRDKEDPLDVARQWIDANPDKVEAWLAGIEGL